MPWHVEKTNQCPKDKPYGVIKTESGKVIKGGCHKTRREAEAHRKAIESNYKPKKASYYTRVRNGRSYKVKWPKRKNG